MLPKEWIAQLFGIAAMVLNILSYQGKKQRTVIAMQFFGGALFAANFLMLGATVGGILNILAVFRALLFLNKEKVKADSPIWLAVFISCFVAVYVLNFTLWGKEVTAFNLILEILPVIGMTALSVGFRMKNAAAIRKLGLISSPAWLIYNISVGSWGATICEILTLGSIFIGMFRHDKKD